MTETQQGHQLPRVHVIWVPPRRDADDVWLELRVFGQLTIDRRTRLLGAVGFGRWATVTCDGDPCECPLEVEAPDVLVRHNGAVVRDGCDGAVVPWLCRLRRAVRSVVQR